VAAVLLATPLDVAARLGRDLTQAELLRLPALLQDASAKVRNYTGRTFTQAETTVRLRVNNGRVKLPQRPVVSITSVKMLNRDGTVGTTLAGWFWDGLAEIATASPSQIANGPWFPNDRYRIVEVTYTHGYSTVPADVLAVVCSIATRALGRKPEDAGLTSATRSTSTASKPASPGCEHEFRRHARTRRHNPPRGDCRRRVRRTGAQLGEPDIDSHARMARST
jgi:hypothetical protein